MSTFRRPTRRWVPGLPVQWSFPKRLIDVIGYHHKLQLSKAAPMETAIVHLSDILLRGLGFGFAGDYAVPPMDPQAWELLDLSRRT